MTLIASNSDNTQALEVLQQAQQTFQHMKKEFDHQKSIGDHYYSQCHQITNDYRMAQTAHQIKDSNEVKKYFEKIETCMRDQTLPYEVRVTACVLANDLASSNPFYSYRLESGIEFYKTYRNSVDFNAPSFRQVTLDLIQEGVDYTDKTLQDLIGFGITATLKYIIILILP